MTSPIQQVVTTTPVEQRSTNDNNGSVSSDGDNDGHHVTTVDDADADIIRLAQTQGLIPEHSLRTPRRQLVLRTVRQREAQLDENPLAEPTTSESTYSSAVRRSPPPRSPIQTNHNGLMAVRITMIVVHVMLVVMAVLEALVLTIGLAMLKMVVVITIAMV